MFHHLYSLKIRISDLIWYTSYFSYPFFWYYLVKYGIICFSILTVMFSIQAFTWSCAFVEPIWQIESSCGLSNYHFLYSLSVAFRLSMVIKSHLRKVVSKCYLSLGSRIINLNQMCSNFIKGCLKTKDAYQTIISFIHCHHLHCFFVCFVILDFTLFSLEIIYSVLSNWSPNFQNTSLKLRYSLQRG